MYDHTPPAAQHVKIYISSKSGDDLRLRLVCQRWDLNPRPFGPAPEAGALDRSATLTASELAIRLI